MNFAGCSFTDIFLIMKVPIKANEHTYQILITRIRLKPEVCR